MKSLTSSSVSASNLAPLAWCLMLALLVLARGASISDSDTTWQDLQERKTAYSDTSRNDIDYQRRRLNMFPDQRWKDRVGDVVQVSYVIDTLGYFDEIEMRLIQDAIEEIAELTKVIRFVPRTNQAAYIHVIGHEDCCCSRVGKDPSGKEQTLSLAYGCRNWGTIQHEFLHALGMHHEQVRPDRDDYVYIYWDFIEEKAKHNFFREDDSTFLGAPYEYSSIMHYGNMSFTVDPDYYTMLPIYEGEIGQEFGITDMDVIKLRLLYQCISGPRSYQEYEANLCTTDCRCWEGAFGCNSDDECQGALTCTDSTCGLEKGECVDYLEWFDSAGDGCDFYEADPEYCDLFSNYTSDVTGESANEACCFCGGGYFTGGGLFNESGCTDLENWVDAEGDSCTWYEQNPQSCMDFGHGFANIFTGKTALEACCHCGGGSLAGVTLFEFRNVQNPDLCLDLVNSLPLNGNFIQLHPCNGSPAQKWWLDNNNYIRSGVKTDVCIVGENGETSEGTNLIINDCYANDDRFVFSHYDDGSISPKLDEFVCFGPSLTEQTALSWPVVEMTNCTYPAPPHQQWDAHESRRRRPESRQDSQDQQGECQDVPLGWYDSSGDNCEWYAEGTRCDDYGSASVNFGATANLACCACGGGSTGPAAHTADMPLLADPIPDKTNTGRCWDLPIGWTDSVGDSCIWYAQGDNCRYYGGQFAGNFGTANEGCCACGGGTSSPPPPSDFTVPGCSDSPSRWMDRDGDNCGWYAEADHCTLYGDSYIGMGGKTAKEACCACGGGYDPNTASSDTTVASSTTATTEEP